MQPTFVLLNGAGLGSWVWRDMLPLLAVPAFAVEYPGRESAATAPVAFDLDGYAAHVVRQIDAHGADKVVLVTHSIGAVVGAKVARSLGDRVAGFIAIGSLVPERGGSFLSSLPWFQRFVMSSTIRVLGTRPPADIVRKGLCNDLSVEQADEVVRRFVPESRSPYFSDAGTFPDCKRMYVVLSKDAQVAPSLQEIMKARFAAGKTVTIASGHLPMLNKPKELADAINGFLS